MEIAITNKATNVATFAPADSWQDELQRRMTEAGLPFSAFDVAPRNSGFGVDLVYDDAGATRVKEAKAALAAGGIVAGAGLYEDGTRMADVGYATQEARKAKDEADMLPAREAIAAHADRIRSERRTDVDVKAGEIASLVTYQGGVKFDGMLLREQAVRGMLTRLASPALGYVLGLRDRIVASHDAADKGHLVATLRRELEANPEKVIRLRTRPGIGDVFAAVSPSYGEADFPSLAGDILAELPDGAKVVIRYDEATTRWSLRGAMWTPTPVQEQVVGEPFRAGLDIGSHDGGLSNVIYGTLAEILACLNAMILIARAKAGMRRHRGSNVLVDVRAGIRSAMTGLDPLLKLWGFARTEVIERPALVPIEEVVPGFYRHMLTVRKGELVGVLRGRTEDHVKKLAMTFDSERDSRGIERDAPVTRIDLLQGWTRVARDIPDLATRQAAQTGISSWLANGEPVRFAAA